jgi:selenocysteine lyase/cysteine desulfurase
MPEMPPLALDAIRADTPALARQTFLASAGASLPPGSVVEATIAHLRLEAEMGGYGAAQQVLEHSEAVYASVAQLIGARPEEIALTESATRAWQLGFYALPWQAGDRILTGRAEYGANFVAFLQIARRYGVTIDIIPDDASGATDPQALHAMLDERVRLIALTWMPSNGGLINPAGAVGAIARAAGIPYLLDACQAVGQVPVDVALLGCDMLCATGRKFLRGPRGTGFLYVRRGFMEGLEPPMIDHAGAPWTAPGSYALRPDARRFEAFESSIAGRLGLGAAADYALGIGLEAIAARNAMLSARLRTGLAALPGAQVLDRGRDHSAIVSFSLAGQQAAAVMERAAGKGIVIGTVAPGSTLLDAQARDLGTILRASPHYFNTEGEIDCLLDLCEGAGQTCPL